MTAKLQGIQECYSPILTQMFRNVAHHLRAKKDISFKSCITIGLWQYSAASDPFDTGRQPLSPCKRPAEVTRSLLILSRKLIAHNGGAKIHGNGGEHTYKYCTMEMSTVLLALSAFQDLIIGHMLVLMTNNSSVMSLISQNFLLVSTSIVLYLG